MLDPTALLTLTAALLAIITTAAAPDALEDYRTRRNQRANRDTQPPTTTNESEPTP